MLNANDLSVAGESVVYYQNGDREDVDLLLQFMVIIADLNGNYYINFVWKHIVVT